MGLIGWLCVAILTVIGVKMCSYYQNRSWMNECNGNKRNFKVRFNPANNKYYIVNDTNYGDIDLRKYFCLKRIYYKSQIDADFVMQKMNGLND